MHVRPPPLGFYPTPVERIDVLSTPTATLWVKRDDKTHPLYGGNKVRKLEYLLAAAAKKGASQILTVGSVGSHHVLATSLFGARAGFGVTALLLPQPRTEHVVENVRADISAGASIVGVKSYLAAILSIVGRMRKGTYWVPVGGSNVTGAMGYVDAARELAAQVRNGELPEPDVVFVTLGSGGTAAGLAAGFALEGMKTRVIGVSVATPARLLGLGARWLAWRCARRAGLRISWRDVWKRLEVDLRYLGKGYGYETAEGVTAMREAERVGLHLDATYTAKTFAAVLDYLKDGASETTRPPTSGATQNILFWHTLSSAPMELLLSDEITEASLPMDVRRLILPFKM